MSSQVSMMEQVKALKNGVGIQSLLDAAHQILGNPLIMFNTGYQLQSYTEIVTDDPIWNELVTRGSFSAEMQELFKAEGFIEAVANAKRTAYLVSEKLKYDRISGKIFDKNNTHIANLLVMACNKPFEPHDLTVFETICKLVTREISKSEFYHSYGKIYQETLIKELINGNIEDRELYAAHVSIIYDGLKTNLFLAAVDISQCDPGYDKLVYFRDLFKQVEAEHRYAIYSNYIIIIISSDSKTLNIDRDLHELYKVFEQNNIYAGISSNFENLFELRKYYMEAQQAVQYVLESKSNQRIFPRDRSAIHTMEQIRSLQNGMGVQYLVDEAYKILGNPVLIHDMDYKLLAHSENADTDDPFWDEFVTYGTVSDGTIDFFKSEGFIDAALGAKAITLLSSAKIKYNRIVGKLFNKDDIMVACVIVVACDKSLEDDGEALLGAFCQAVSREISESDFYSNYGQAYSETLISKLIDGSANDYELFSDSVASIYDNLKANLYLAVVDATQSDPEHTHLAYFRDLFKQLQTAYKYAIYSNYIIIIISSDSATLSICKDLDEMGRLFEQNNIYAGISSRFGNIYELRKQYSEAVSALNDGLKSKEKQCGQRIFLYDDKRRPAN